MAEVIADTNVDGVDANVAASPTGEDVVPVIDTNSAPFAGTVAEVNQDLNSEAP